MLGVDATVNAAQERILGDPETNGVCQKVPDEIEIDQNSGELSVKQGCEYASPVCSSALPF